jgi:hypothetical protein
MECGADFLPARDIVSKVQKQRSPLRVKESFPNLLRGMLLHKERIYDLNDRMSDGLREDQKTIARRARHARYLAERNMLWNEIRAVLIDCGMHKISATRLARRFVGW